MIRKTLTPLILLLLLPLTAEQVTIFNASYDIAREFFSQINPMFSAAYRQRPPYLEVEIKQSYGGSSKQANAILNGLPADVATFNQEIDIQTLVAANLVASDWPAAFANQSSPYYSLPVFLLRKKSLAKISDWGDLAAKNLKILFPNPRTSGNGRYTYLAAWAWSVTSGQSVEQRHDFIRRFLANVLLFDTGGRSASNSFTKRKLGDVLITFEAEALRLVNKEPGKYRIVIPSLSVLAQFPVALVNRAGQSELQRQVASDYLNFLYSDAAQRQLVKLYYRSNNQKIMATVSAQFPAVKLLTVEDDLGGWQRVSSEHFAENALFDQLVKRR